jgi:glycosyltransferase A (GT-A) superfamily protein (DUF2064 family)
MLGDVLETSADYAARLDLIPVLAFYPPDASGELLGLAPSGFRLHVQRGFDLGERMANAFAEASAAGAERILLRGSDSPALEWSLFEMAMNRLDSGDDLVLTPDQSGGYAMIGLRSPQPALFELSMSTEDVMEQTARIADRLGLRSSTTASGFDLDTMGDFHCFDALSPAQRSDLCPRTIKSMSSLPLASVL